MKNKLCPQARAMLKEMGKGYREWYSPQCEVALGFQYAIWRAVRAAQEVKDEKQIRA